MLLLDHYRTAQGLSFRDLERISGVDRAVLWMYANHKRQPSVGRAYEIAQALGVTLDELYVPDPPDGHGDDGATPNGSAATAGTSAPAIP